jgi:hypothetical protein
MNDNVLKILSCAMVIVILLTSSGWLILNSPIDGNSGDEQTSVTSTDEQVLLNSYPFDESLLSALYTSKATKTFSDGVQHEVKAASTVSIPIGCWGTSLDGWWNYKFVVTGMGESTNGDCIDSARMEIDGRSNESSSTDPLIMTHYNHSDISWSMPSTSGESFDYTPEITLVAQTLIGLLNPSATVSMVSSLLLSFIGMIKGTSSGYTIGDNHFIRMLDWNPRINWTSQNMVFMADVLPGYEVSFTAEYGVFGPTFEYLSAGTHVITITAPPVPEDGPSSMTAEERDAAGIFTVPRVQLQSRASELGLSDATVQEMMDSDKDEFYFTSATPMCITEESDESNVEYGSQEDLLDVIAEKISLSEKIIAAFSQDEIRDLQDSRAIVAKHTVRVECLQALDRLVRFSIHSQNLLERAYDMYWNIIGHTNDLISDFGNDVLLNGVSSNYIRDALSRGPAILSHTQNGLKASASNLFNILESDGVLLVSSDWLDVSTARMDLITDLAASGNRMILLGDNPDVLSAENIGLSTAFSGSAGVYGLWYDEENDATYCYSDSGDNLNGSIEAAFEWAETAQSNIYIPEQYLAPADSVVYSLTKTHGSFGDLIVNTKYDIIEVQPDEFVVITHYKLTGDANVSTGLLDRWTAIADLRVSCQHENSELIDYGPTTGPYGVGIQYVDLYDSDSEIDAQWMFIVGDAVFHDQTTMSNDTFSLWYDIGECEASNGRSYSIEPGTISRVYIEDIEESLEEIEDETGLEIQSFRYCETEHYSVSFARDRVLLPYQLETVECDIMVTLI